MRSRIIQLVNVFTLATACGLILGILLAGWAQGSIWRLTIGFFVAAWDTSLVAVVALFAHIFNARKTTYLCSVVIVAALIQLCTFSLVGYTNYLQNLTDVQAYGQSIVYQLEQYRTQHGHYPDVLDTTNTAQPSVKLWEDSLIYSRAGDQFLLTFLHSDALDALWIYDGVTKQWKLIRNTPSAAQQISWP